MDKSHLVGQLLNSIHDARTHVYKICLRNVLCKRFVAFGQHIKVCKRIALQLNRNRLIAASCVTNSRPSLLLLKEIEKIVAGCVMQTKSKVDLMLMDFQCACGKGIEDVAVNKLMYCLCMYRVRLG